MRQTKRQSKAVAVAAVLMMAIGRAQAQESPEKQGRRLVVSIPDCKLALVDNGKVVKVYQTAVGAAVSPSPTGTFQIVTRIPHPAARRRHNCLHARFGDSGNDGGRGMVRRPRCRA